MPFLGSAAEEGAAQAAINNGITNDLVNDITGWMLAAARARDKTASAAAQRRFAAG
jgi:hypothetical protein